MPQNAFFPWTRNLLVSQEMMQRHFFPPTLHLFSLAFVLLRNSRFNFHCYTQHEATPTQKLGRKWHCDLSRLLAQKITKGTVTSCDFLRKRLQRAFTHANQLPWTAQQGWGAQDSHLDFHTAPELWLGIADAYLLDSSLCGTAGTVGMHEECTGEVL